MIVLYFDLTQYFSNILVRDDQEWRSPWMLNDSAAVWTAVAPTICLNI